MFRVLSLDGGGIKGAFAAAALARLEEVAGRPLADCFDLIIGTSTGGILALGLAFGVKADTIRQMYQEKAFEIFPKNARSFAGWFEGWFEPKYNTEGLERALVDIFKDRKFGDTKYRLAVPSFDAISGRPVVFRSPALNPHSKHHDLKVVQVALATSAAPTFFPASTIAQTEPRVLLDGGVWANCPILVGIAEAIHTCDRQLHSINVLSIGTTTSPFSIPKEVSEGGAIKWAKPFVTLFMHAGRLGALELATKLCGFVERLDEEVAPDRFSLDDSTGVNDLISLGRDAADRKIDQISARFLSNPQARQ